MAEGIDRSAYLGAFREETEEHLQALTELLISLESEPESRKSLDEVFRHAHTVKGTARMMGFGQVADIAHAMEDILDDLRAGRLRSSPPLLDALLTATDLLRNLVSASPQGSGAGPDVETVRRWLGELRLSGGAASAAGMVAEAADQWDVEPASERRGPLTARETIRVDVQKIDTILNLSGELSIVEAARRQWSAEVARLAERLQVVSVAARAGDMKRVLEDVQAVAAAASRVSKQCRRLSLQEAELTHELHYQASALRLLPVQSLFSLVPRAVRDLARERGKEIDVVVEGEDTEIDREVLERVKDSVLHLVRNAVAHGIESPAERLAAGKPRAGRVRVAAHSRGEQVIVEIEDDGKGVDLGSVRDAAVRKGLLDPTTAEHLDETDCIKLLFLPGFTTAPQVAETSGRGVGLDVVKCEVDALKGRVLLETREGEGTRVILELPITLAFHHVVLFEVGRLTCGLLCSSIHGIADVPSESVRILGGRETATVDGRVVPLVLMRHLLKVGDGGAMPGRRWPVVLSGPPQRPVGLVVDRVIGEEDVVVKPLGPLVRRVPHVSGGIILGDGRIAFLLSASAVSDAQQVKASSGGRTSGRAAHAPRRVLVVDDSAITRELERTILEAAGYQVETAVDGRDGLAKLKSRGFDLVVSDVQMPGLDGFGLAAAIRADPNLVGLPIVIVSSRESEEDRRRGLEVGVQAYLGKGSFDQVTLLDTIEQLIG